MAAQHRINHPQSRPDTARHADPDPLAYEAQVYQRGLKYQRPPFTFKPLDWEALAADRMSADARGYVLGCAGTGETARRNRESFAKWGIVPRRLGLGQGNDNNKEKGKGNGEAAEDAEGEKAKNKKVFPNLGVRVLGRNIPCPIACAPVGVQKIMNPDGEAAAARAAAREGVPFVMSTASSTSIEDVARASDAGAAGAERWFQLYWPAREHDDVTASLLRRAKEAGFSVLVVTLDTYILGWRPSDMDNGYNPFLRSDQIGVAIGLTDPVFRAHFERKHGRAVDADPEDLGAAAAEWTRTVFPGAEHALSDIASLRALWGHDAPIVLKGIQSPDDARLIAESGLVDGIIVSNHGGRQADGGISSLGALPRVVEAVDAVNEANSSPRSSQGEGEGAGKGKGKGEEEGEEGEGPKQTRRKVEVLFDSGIRCGADIAKALALGAKMCLIGRPYVYGLALGGEEGVAHVLRSLLGDLELTLHLSGIRSVGQEDLNRGCLVKEDELF